MCLWYFRYGIDRLHITPHTHIHAPIPHIYTCTYACMRACTRTIHNSLEHMVMEAETPQDQQSATCKPRDRILWLQIKIDNLRIMKNYSGNFSQNPLCHGFFILFLISLLNLESLGIILPTCLGECFQRDFNHIERAVINVGDSILLVRVPEWIKRVKVRIHLGTCIHPSSSCLETHCDKWPHTPATMLLHHDALHAPATHEPKQSIPSLSCFCQKFCQSKNNNNY